MKLVVNLILMLVLFVFALSTSNCRSTKNISKAISKKDSVITQISIDHKTNTDSIKLVESVLNKIDSNYISFNTFSAKVKVDYNSDGQNVPDVNAFIRIKRDSVIWINIEKLSYNFARILITKDSFYLSNKLDRTITIRPLSYFVELTEIPFDYKTIENLLIGNPVYFKRPITTFKQNENTMALMCIGDLFKHLITINKNNFLVQHSKLDDIDITRNRTCDFSYDSYETKDGKNFSKERSIVISEKTKIEINLKFKQFNFNEPLSFPFQIPTSYKKL